MADFQLPTDLMHNRGLIQDPTAYAKEVGCRSWLFLVGDEFASMPGAFPTPRFRTPFRTARAS